VQVRRAPPPWAAERLPPENAFDQRAGCAGGRRQGPFAADDVGQRHPAPARKFAVCADHEHEGLVEQHLGMQVFGRRLAGCARDQEIDPADRDQLQAIWSRLRRTQEVVERGTSAVAASRMLLAENDRRRGATDGPGGGQGDSSSMIAKSGDRFSEKDHAPTES